jgi:2-hydroxychromene-2-carboxylate isomerase
MTQGAAEKIDCSPELEFFYDCSSVWSYFAFTRIVPLMKNLDLSIRWRPILVGGVFNAVNREVYSNRSQMLMDSNRKRVRDHYLKDIQDWATLCGIQAIIPPDHPINSVKVMRGAFFAQEQGLLVPYSTVVFEKYWGGENPDIGSDEAIIEICQKVGLDTESFFTAISSQRYKDLLRRNTDELIARGGYGSPTIFINGNDMYFGNDRLPLVEYKLKKLLGYF